MGHGWIQRLAELHRIPRAFSSPTGSANEQEPIEAKRSRRTRDEAVEQPRVAGGADRLPLRQRVGERKLGRRELPRVVPQAREECVPGVGVIHCAADGNDYGSRGDQSSESVDAASTNAAASARKPYVISERPGTPTTTEPRFE